MPGDTYDAIVIGAGANGLAAAATLARAGKRTLVLERGDAAGGSCTSFEFAPGFHASPLALDGGWLAPVIARGLSLETESAITAAAGRPVGPAPGFMHVQPWMTVAAEPGHFLNVPSGPDRAAQISDFSSTDAQAWPDFVRRLKSMVAFLESLYLEPPPDLDASGAGELLSLGLLALQLRRTGRAAMTDLLRTLPMSVAELLDDTFESDTLKAAIAAVGVRGLRQGPRSGGTAFNLLHNLVGGGTTPGLAWGGRYRPVGADTVVAAFEAAARRDGAVIRTSAPVARIAIDDYAVSGVILESGEEIGARVVFSSADPRRSLLGMVDSAWLDPEFIDAVRNIRYRASTSFVLYATDTLPELPGLSDSAEVLAGTVSLTPTMTALEQAYDATKYEAIAERPHIELSVPSLRWKGMAPDGKHVVIARVHYTPYPGHTGTGGAGVSPRTGRDERGNAGVADASELADRVTEAIAGIAPGFTDRVLHRSVLTPADIESRYGYAEGAISQGELMLDQILFMRPVAGWSRYAMPIDGLYLCGAGTHPGPGVPGAPGWLAAGEALRHTRD